MSILQKVWVGNGIICEDIDECNTLENPCGYTQCCINKPGGFECKHSPDKRC